MYFMIYTVVNIDFYWYLLQKPLFVIVISRFYGLKLRKIFKIWEFPLRGIFYYVFHNSFEPTEHLVKTDPCLIRVIHCSAFLSLHLHCKVNERLFIRKLRTNYYELQTICNFSLQPWKLPYLSSHTLETLIYLFRTKNIVFICYRNSNG